MSIVKGNDSRISLNVQHDYITLRTPNGNYTYGRNGSKSSGNLVLDGNSFVNLEKFIRSGTNLLDSFKELLNPSTLSNYWKGWDIDVKVNSFEIGDRVMFNHPIFLKKYPNGGVVMTVKRKTVYLKLIDDNKQIIGFDYQVLKKV